MLKNGGCCPWHGGSHTYTLTPRLFTAARDREFTESCLALGVKPQNILISPLRGPDGGLTKEQARRIMLHAIQGLPAREVAVTVTAPMPEHGQNPDHTAVGQAAKELFTEGAFGALTLLHEFIFLPPDLTLTAPGVLLPSAEELSRIQKAAACYRRWAPEHGRYAVGYHSVFDEFNSFLSRPLCVSL